MGFTGSGSNFLRNFAIEFHFSYHLFVKGKDSLMIHEGDMIWPWNRNKQWRTKNSLWSRFIEDSNQIASHFSGRRIKGP